MRLLASGDRDVRGDSTLTSEQVASSFSIRSDLLLANGIEASVKSTTPARPLDWLMIQSALIFATSSTLVVMLLKSFGALLGPGVPTACQPMSGMPAALACATCCAVDLGSKPPMTMPEGFRATAWLSGGLDAGRGALAVDDPDLPADGLGGLLDAFGDARDTGVGHGLGDVDDGLAGDRLGAGGRAVPGGVDGLGARDRLLGLRQDGGAAGLRGPADGGGAGALGAPGAACDGSGEHGQGGHGSEGCLAGGVVRHGVLLEEVRQAGANGRERVAPRSGGARRVVVDAAVADAARRRSRQERAPRGSAPGADSERRVALAPARSRRRAE